MSGLCGQVSRVLSSLSSHTVDGTTGSPSPQVFSVAHVQCLPLCGIQGPAAHLLRPAAFPLLHPYHLFITPSHPAVHSAGTAFLTSSFSPPHPVPTHTGTSSMTFLPSNTELVVPSLHTPLAESQLHYNSFLTCPIPAVLKPHETGQEPCLSFPSPAPKGGWHYSRAQLLFTGQIKKWANAVTEASLAHPAFGEYR